MQNPGRRRHIERPWFPANRPYHIRPGHAAFARLQLLQREQAAP